ncbi:MAG: glycosyltransferase [Gammaproteobacteria bacterium]
MATYRNPWDLPLSERLLMLQKGRKRVAYFYEKPDSSTFRYRVYNMAQVLNDGEGDISASYFFLSDVASFHEIADSADMLVICRARYDANINHLITAFRRKGKKILFDVDDLIFNPDFVHLIVRTLGINMGIQKHWDDWFAYSSRIGETLLKCDGVIATNEYLADRIRDFSRLPTTVIPNFLNKEQVDVSSQLFDSKQQRLSESKAGVQLGYFSGSATHAKDLAIALPFLEALMEETPSLSLTVAGYIQLDSLVKRFGSHRVKYLRFTDFINLQRLISEVDFNLVPLQYNAFSHCKSELKYFEAAVVGTQTIASPTFTYANVIRDGDNGYLSKAYEWDVVIKRAMDALPCAVKMAERARDDALKNFAWYHQKSIILKALGS